MSPDIDYLAAMGDTDTGDGTANIALGSNAEEVSKLEDDLAKLLTRRDSSPLAAVRPLLPRVLMAFVIAVGSISRILPDFIFIGKLWCVLFHLV